MLIYNTLSRKKEEFIPHEEGKVKMYTCGPTVYHYAHIGNIRNYIGHDILEKTLRYLGYDVTRAMNITDVGHLTSDSDSGEDKMAVASKREHKSAMEIAQFYTEAFFKDFFRFCEQHVLVVIPRAIMPQKQFLYSGRAGHQSRLTGCRMTILLSTAETVFTIGTLMIKSRNALQLFRQLWQIAGVRDICIAPDRICRTH